jgi:aryl-alcohol dehydrogenase-like predicted oxidoreductase
MLLLSRLARKSPSLTHRHFRFVTSRSQFKMVHTLPFQDITVNSPGFGAMGMSFGLGSNLNLEQAEPVLLKAIELGCTFWDTAVVYQAGVNEKLLGDFIRKHDVRDKVFIASKCGFNCMNGGDGSVTNSASHIKEYIEGTIERLGFTPDLYYLHRIDPSKLCWKCRFASG